MKKIITLLLALVLLAMCASADTLAAPEGYLGNTMPDFTVTTIDGETFALKDALKTHKAVMVNLWATWCGPCEMEFPYIEEAYEAYKDDVAIIALSVEPEDSDGILSEYAASHGLTFPVANGWNTGLYEKFVDKGIPTTVMVDRFGNVVLIEVGAQSSAVPFTATFDLLISDAYTETTVLDGFAKEKPNVEGGSEELLAGILGLDVESSKDEYAWPFVPANDDGKNCVVSSNAGKDDTKAELLVYADAKAGDVFSFSLRTSTETYCDLLVVSLNGTPVKYFSGEKDWMSYAIRLEEGENEISLAYVKDFDVGFGEDSVYLDDFELLSGDEAEQALSLNPVYIYAEETAIVILSDEARRVEFLNENGEQFDFTGTLGYNASFYVADDISVSYTATLSEGVDPELVYVISDYDMVPHSAYEVMNGAALTTGVDTMDLTGYPESAIMIIDNGISFPIAMTVVFADEANVEAFMDMVIAQTGAELHYSYLDEGEDEGIISFEGADGKVKYYATFVDQYGDPVPGCVINFCTDTACTPVFSDASGLAEFEGEPYPYHVQVIRVPAGYEFDTRQEFTLGENGDVLALLVTKN